MRTRHTRKGPWSSPSDGGHPEGTGGDTGGGHGNGGPVVAGRKDWRRGDLSGLTGNVHLGHGPDVEVGRSVPSTASSTTFFGVMRLWPSLILAVALSTRLWAVDWQLAALYFDEMKYVDWANRAVGGGPQLVSDLRNPTVYHHLLQVQYALTSLGRTDRSDEETSIFRLALARVTSAFLGAVACLLTGLAAAALVSRAGSRTSADSGDAERWRRGATRSAGGPAGLVAGCMLALSLLHVHMSHYALNDAPALAFLAGSLLFGTRAIAGGRRDLLLAGLLAGLAFTTKYNFGVILLLPLAVATVVRPQSEKAGPPWTLRRLPVGCCFLVGW